jgi:hypothetical protein
LAEGTTAGFGDETFAEIENFVGLGYRWANPTVAG